VGGGGLRLVFAGGGDRRGARRVGEGGPAVVSMVGGGCGRTGGGFAGEGGGGRWGGRLGGSLGGVRGVCGRREGGVGVVRWGER